MKHVRALCLKFIVSLVLLYVVLTLFFGVPFGEMFVLTLFLGVISYLVGDLLFSRREQTIQPRQWEILAFHSY
nr:DUF2512 family protein [Bacillus licheniformis]